MRVRIIGRPSLGSARCDADKHLSAILSKVDKTAIKPCESVRLRYGSRLYYAQPLP